MNSRKGNTVNENLDIIWAKMAAETEETCRKAGVMGYSIRDPRPDGRRFPGRCPVPDGQHHQNPHSAVWQSAFTGDLDWTQRVAVEDKDKVGGSGVLGRFAYKADIALRDLAGLMISLSDNTATNICIDLATMDLVNETMRSLGLTNTLLRRKMMDIEAARRGERTYPLPGGWPHWSLGSGTGGIPGAVAEDVLSILSLPKQAVHHGAAGGRQEANKPGGGQSFGGRRHYLPHFRPALRLAVCGGFLPGGPRSHRRSRRKAFGYMKIWPSALNWEDLERCQRRSIAWEAGRGLEPDEPNVYRACQRTQVERPRKALFRLTAVRFAVFCNSCCIRLQASSLNRQRLIYAVFDQNPESHPVGSATPVFNLITEFRSALADPILLWCDGFAYLVQSLLCSPCLAALCASLTAWFVAAYDAMHRRLLLDLSRLDCNRRVCPASNVAFQPQPALLVCCKSHVIATCCCDRCYVPDSQPICRQKPWEPNRGL